MTIDTQESYTASKAYKTCAPILKRLFRSEQGFREFLDRDRSANNFFNSKALDQSEGTMTRVIMHGTDLQHAIDTLQKILNVDISLHSQTHVYSKSQMPHGPKQELFVMSSDFDSGAGAFIIRVVRSEHDREDGAKERMYCFTREYLLTLPEERRQKFAGNAPARFPLLSNAQLVL